MVFAKKTFHACMSSFVVLLQGNLVLILDKGADTHFLVLLFESAFFVDRQD